MTCLVRIAAPDVCYFPCELPLRSRIRTARFISKFKL